MDISYNLPILDELEVLGMARPFAATDAKRLSEEHKTYLAQLKVGETAPEQCRMEIEQAARSLVAQEVIKILRDIPVEEINREKRGFRVKALREHGFSTIADLSSVSVHSIASVRGISVDSAYAIKCIVDELVNQAKTGTKIRLSVDNKTPAATQLVTAVSKYKCSLQQAERCRQLLGRHSRTIAYALEDLTPGQSGFLWLFTSKLRKQKAQEAYDLLGGLLSNEYGREVQTVLQEMSHVRGLLGSAAWDDFAENSIRFYNILEDICPGLLGTDDAVYGLPEELAREIQEECFFPDGLLCELRRYQEWGVKYILHQERVLLGDEMGLGKTVQAIATMVSLKNTGATHFVVVCPASVIENWCREIRKHSRLSVTKVHGVGRMEALHSWIQGGGVAITTYKTAEYFKLDDRFCFSMLTVDEAHYIKNPQANRTVNVKMIASHAQRVLFMTGTALENKVDEMIELISILQPAVASQVYGMASLSSAPQFRKKVAPVYYRRKREDVLTELPELIENQEWCTLRPEEEAIYENAVLGKHYSDARRVSWNVDDLRNSSKASRMLELIVQAESEGRKVIVFSFFRDTIRKISMLLGSKCTEPITGSVSSQRRQEIIDGFDRSPAGTVLMAQIEAGGTGLNIQSASVVILCEPQFKPSIENQAISRAYRMGQTRNVLVYRLLCQNTVDERITALLEQKQAAFDAFADKSEAAKQSLDMDEKTFGNIIKEEIDRINAKNGKGAPEEQ